MVPTLSRTHVHKNAVNRVRVSWLLSDVPAAVECNSLNISCFLIIGCVALRTLKCVTTCVIGVYVSWSFFCDYYISLQQYGKETIHTDTADG